MSLRQDAVGVQLVGTNFPIWKQRVIAALRGKSLYTYCISETYKDPKRIVSSSEEEVKDHLSSDDDTAKTVPLKETASKSISEEDLANVPGTPLMDP